MISSFLEGVREKSLWLQTVSGCQASGKLCWKLLFGLGIRHVRLISQLLLNISTLFENLAQADPWGKLASIEETGSVITKAFRLIFIQKGRKILLDELKEAGVNLDYKGPDSSGRCGLVRFDRCANEENWNSLALKQVNSEKPWCQSHRRCI